MKTYALMCSPSNLYVCLRSRAPGPHQVFTNVEIWQICQMTDRKTTRKIKGDTLSKYF